MAHPQRSILAAVMLFFIAPLVAEYLLGDFPITFLSPLILMTPLYGGGALLIREVTRRNGRGWPTMLLLGAAYALVEEGYTTQTLFNPNFFNLHLNLLRFAWIPALGIGGWWTVFMLNVHPFFSIGVSIALVEGLFPARNRTPWLGNIGLGIVALLYAAAVYLNTAYTIHTYHFVASRMQFLVTGLVCVVFVAAAFLIPRPAQPTKPDAVPSPWATGAVAFVLSAAVFFAPLQFNWGAVAWILAVDFTFLLLLGLFSRRSSWTPLHTFSVGAGGALFYGVHAFMQPPIFPASKAVVLTSHVFLLVLAAAVVMLGVRRTKAALTARAPATPTAIL
jgi:hypothetical protein